MNENIHPKLYEADPMLFEIDPKRADLFVPISFPSSERDFDLDALIRHARRLIERDTIFGQRDHGKGQVQPISKETNR